MMTKKIRTLTFGLIFSVALNAGLFIAFILCTGDEPFLSTALNSSKEKVELSNKDLLATMSQASFRELLSFLTNRDCLEDGYTKRDLAVASLVAFHHFNVEKALSGAPSQVRLLQMSPTQSIEIFPGLTEDDFQAIIRFAYQEKWPFTSKGLWLLVKKNQTPSLIEAFVHTPEFSSFQMLFQKTGAPQDEALLLSLVREGTFDLFEQKRDFSIQQRRELLCQYLSLHSSVAAEILLRTDFLYAVKKMDDATLLMLLSELKSGMDEGKRFCVELLRSPRSDCVWQAAAQKLYALNGESLPAPVDPKLALSRFTQEEIPVKQAPLMPVAPPVAPSHFHIVKEGESLWKISKMHKVKVDEIAKMNGLENNAIFPGMTLKLPQGTGSEPPR